MEEKTPGDKFITLAIGSGILFMIPSVLVSMAVWIIVTKE
jgi:flagellar biosynthesis component FlhA